MSTITDPARELSDLVRGLNINTDALFAEGLSELFGVEAWSSEFYQIIFAISHRVDELASITDTLRLDDDQRQEAKEGLRTIQMAFRPEGLLNVFNHSQRMYLSPEQIKPLSLLSAVIRPIRSYPKLDENEKADILAMVSDLLGWLEDRQLSEQDFIRQSLVEGLKQLKFRLERITWLGWGYTLQSLRDVIAAYFALERGFPRANENTSAHAMMKMLGDFVRDFFRKAGFAKDTIETGDFMLKFYGTVQLALAGQTTIAGLLSHAS